MREKLRAELAQIVVEDDARRLRTVAVHIDERVEAPLGRAEKPVDRAFFVAFDVVRVKLAEEVVADAVVPLVLDVQPLLDEAEVFLVLLRSEGRAQKGAEPFGDAVGEPVAVDDGDDVLLVRRKERPRDATQIVVESLPLVGEDQAGFVQRISAEHAPDGIGDQLAHGVRQQQRLQLLLALARAVPVVRVAGEGDLVQRHLGGQFVLEAVGVDEDAVVLLLKPLHLQRGLPPTGAKMPVRFLQRRPAMFGGKQREDGEVPGNFVGVPVEFSNGNNFFCPVDHRMIRMIAIRNFCNFSAGETQRGAEHTQKFIRKARTKQRERAV